MYKQSKLWTDCFADRNPDPHSEKRQELRNALGKVRERAGIIAEQINHVLPNLTSHDITHLDALWEYADLVVGDSFTLTPCEGFALGVAFLLHDLGLSVLALPNGMKDAMAHPLWSDTVVSLEESDGLTDDQISRRALFAVLREVHASIAEDLATKSWVDSLNKSYHIIEDSDLRSCFGALVGRLAHSHWWPIERVHEAFGLIIGAPGRFPAEWHVDPLKIACILRAADFAHLDERRAPSFRRALCGPLDDECSELHWRFQAQLNRPTVHSGRLLYSSKTSFAPKDIDAWWLCFDTLCELDRELGAIDALFVELSRPRLTVQGVFGANDPRRLSMNIPTHAWLPVDTRLRVSAVANLVATLGGAKLYGDNARVPLRELIQNSTDAINARRQLEGRDSSWGMITVKAGADEDGEWLEVQDNGIGMSERVLIGPFLDFGNSFWKTPLAREEFPGLQSSGFHSIGQYGIGFFSVFMWGDRVRVITRRPDAAKNDTLVLEFVSGLGHRPVLKKGMSCDQLFEPGTCIRIWFRSSCRVDSLYQDKQYDATLTLSQVICEIAPCSEVTISCIERSSGPVIAVKANDWKSVDDSVLYGRLNPAPRKNARMFEPVLTPPPLLPLKSITGNSGCWGRAALHVSSRARFDPDNVYGVVTVGGFTSCRLNGIAGILVGSSIRASRDAAIPTVPLKLLQQWAESQIPKILEDADAQRVSHYAEILRALGVDCSILPFARTSSGWVNGSRIQELAGAYDTLIIVSDDAYELWCRDHGAVILKENVIIVDCSRISLLATPVWGLVWDWPQLRGSKKWGQMEFHSKSLEGLAIEMIAKGWNLPLKQVLKESLFSTDEKSHSAVIGEQGDVPVKFDHVAILRRPRGECMSSHEGV